MFLPEERAGPCLVPSNRTLHYWHTGIVTDPCSAPLYPAPHSPAPKSIAAGRERCASMQGGRGVHRCRGSLLKCVLLSTLLSSNPCSVALSTLAHAARMQHPHLHNHREVLRRSNGAVRKDRCTVCKRTVFTPCRRTHSAVDTRRWREESTSVWPNRCQPVARSALQPPRHPPPACVCVASTTIEAPHYAASSDAFSPSFRPRSSSAHPDAHRRKPCNVGLGAAAPSLRQRRHLAHPNARHP